MANSTFDVLELRVVIKPEWTELYIRCSSDSEGGALVGGWYKTTIPPSTASLPALTEALSTCSYLTSDAWSRGAPPP